MDRAVTDLVGERRIAGKACARRPGTRRICDHGNGLLHAAAGADLAELWRMLMPTLARYMTAPPVTIERGSTLAVAERLMRAHQIRHLPVIAQGKPIGILVAHDLHMLELVGRLDLETVRVEAVMAQDPFSVNENAPLDEVVDAMARRRLDAVIVTDPAGVRGIFTAVDACEALASVLRRAVA